MLDQNLIFNENVLVTVNNQSQQLLFRQDQLIMRNNTIIEILLIHLGLVDKESHNMALKGMVCIT